MMDRARGWRALTPNGIPLTSNLEDGAVVRAAAGLDAV